MPFTGSHAAAILPFARWGLPASALVVGSFSPDLPYYLPVPISAYYSHSPVGVIGVDLILGLAVLAVWQAFVGRAVVAFAPAIARTRLAGYPVGLRRLFGHPARLASCVIALVLGGFTHIAWDSFTHDHGWGYDRVAWLRTAHGPLAGYQWAHAASEVVAAVALSVWCLRWWRADPVDGRAAAAGPSLGTRVAAGAMVGVAAAVGALRGLDLALARASRHVAFEAITGGGLWGGTALVGVAAVWTLARRRLDAR